MVDVDIDWNDASLDAAFEELEGRLSEAVRGVALVMWDNLLLMSPQYHGRFVASWSYQVGAPNPQDRSDLIDVDSRSNAGKAKDDDTRFRGLWAGHDEAIGIANRENQGADTLAPIGQDIYITNGVDHGQGPYSYSIHIGDFELRPENLPGQPVDRALDVIEQRFAEVTESQASWLRRKRIGS